MIFLNIQEKNHFLNWNFTNISGSYIWKGNWRNKINWVDKNLVREGCNCSAVRHPNPSQPILATWHLDQWHGLPLSPENPLSMAYSRLPSSIILRNEGDWNWTAIENTCFTRCLWTLTCVKEHCWRKTNICVYVYCRGLDASLNIKSSNWSFGVVNKF